MTSVDNFLGRSKRSAQDLAEASNMIFRLIRIDDNRFFDYPAETEQILDRVCVEIDNGKVSKAKIC